MPQLTQSGIISEESPLSFPQEGVDIEIESSFPNIIDGTEFIEEEDGSILIDFAPQMKSPYATPFKANLVEELDPNVISVLTEDLLEAIESDIGSRSEWEETLKKGMEYLGLKYEERTMPFINACGIYDSTMLQAALMWQANAICELLPIEGPVDTKIYGKDDDLKLEQANLVKKFMNFYLTQVATEFLPDMDQMFMWLCITGMTFKKTYQDPIALRPKSPYIQPNNVIVSDTNTKDLASCPRITHVIPAMTYKEMRELQLAGVYLDVKIMPDNDEEDDSSSIIQQQVDTIQGTTLQTYDKDKKYTLYECHVDLDIKGLEHKDAAATPTGLPLPYIVTIVKESRKIIGLRRNWEENDPKFNKIPFFTAYKFFQGLGFYGYGFAHVMGGSARAITSIERQLIDAGTFANFPGGVRIKGLKFENNNIAVGPGEFPEIDTGGLPLRDAIMPLPYAGPNLALMELKNSLVIGAEKLGALSNINFNDTPQNLAVGTVLALLENSMKLPNSIMRRVYVSMREEFKLMGKLFAQYLPDQPYKFKMIGDEGGVIPEDFNDNIAIIPTGDPVNSSSAHRLIKAQTELNFAREAPELHDMRYAYERIYKVAGISDIDKLLPPPQQAKRLDPVSENQNAILNVPLKAFLEQDHMAHIAVHSSEADIANLPAMQAHIQAHIAMEYRLKMQERLGVQLPEPDQELPPEAQNEIAMLAAQATQQMTQQQQEAAPPPLDPALVMLEEVKVKDKEVEMRFKEAEMKAETEAFKAQLKYESDQAKREIDEKIAILDAKTELAITKIKALTELQKQDEKNIAEEGRTEANELAQLQEDIRGVDNMIE